jgi:tyrosine-protein kinase Etk/Wzc
MKKDTKDFMYYYALLLNNWYWLVLGLIVGVSLFYVNLRYSITLYKVSGSILIEDTQGKSLSKEIVAMGAGADQADASIEDRIKILSSTELMSRIVDSLTLNVSYIEEGRMKTYEMFDNSPLKLLYWNTEGAAKSFQLRVKHYDSLRFALYRTEGKPEYIKYGVPFKYDKRELVLKKIGDIDNRYFINIVVKDAYSTAVEYSSKLEIAQLGRSNILNISMIEVVPERAIAIINRLIQEYGIANMENKNNAGKRTMNFIEQRLSYVASELYNVEDREEGFKRDKSLPVMLPELAKSYMDRSNLVEEKIMALDIRSDLVKNIETIIVAQNPTEKYRPLPFSTEILGSGPLTILIQRYNEIIYKRSQILESAKENNPMLTTNDEELKNLKNNILISIQTIKQEVNEQKEKYRQQMIPLETQLSLIPSNERELTKIMREKGIKETLFLYLLQKREEIALNVAAQVAHSRMLERASNKGKVAPHPVQMALFYIFLGLGIPVLGLYLKDLFNNKVFHRADLDKHLNVPFVGFIPHVKGKPQKLIINDSHSVLSESFRLVRSNLQNTDFENEKKTILITSAISGEGKSFVAVNLALTLALTGKKIILLGLDLRRPKLELYLEGKTSEKGIANFLNGEGPLSKFIQKYDRMPNLDFVDCGKVPQNPAELMVFDKLKIMFDYCHKHYDFVVVDAPPVGLVADTFSLKEYIGQTLVVFRYGYSRIEHIKLIKEIKTTNKLPHLNILLNDVRPERGNMDHYVNYSDYYKQEDKSVLTKIKKWIKSLRKPKETVAKNIIFESINSDITDPELIVENESEPNKKVKKSGNNNLKKTLKNNE